MAGVISIRQAIEGYQIGKFIAEVGMANAVHVVADFIKRQVESFGLQKTITDNQIFEAAKLIVQEHPLLTVEDIAMMFREAKMMKDGYEKPYGRIDVSLIFSWLNNYLDHRLDNQDAEYLQEKKQQQNDAFEMAANLADLLEPLISKKPLPVITPVIQRPSLEKQDAYIRANMANYDTRELHSLIKQFRSHHTQVYNGIIAEMETEIMSRNDK